MPRNIPKRSLGAKRRRRSAKPWVGYGYNHLSWLVELLLDSIIQTICCHHVYFQNLLAFWIWQKKIMYILQVCGNMLMKIQMYVGITETTESKYSGSQSLCFLGVTYIRKLFSLLLMLPRQPPVVYLHPTPSHPACKDPPQLRNTKFMKYTVASL